LRFSPRHISKIFLLLCLTAALFAGGCARRPAPPAAGDVLAGRWYQLAGGAFEPAAFPGDPPVAAQPWTVQARVSDLAVLDGRLYLAVNGHGLAAVLPPLTASASAEFRYFYDPLLFRYRTLTALVPAGGAVTCHLYYNSLLNVAGAGELPVGGLSLLRLYPQDGAYQRVLMPFQLAHRGWECVGFAPLSAQEFLLEWKLAGPERTLFDYTRYSLDSLTERPAGRREYRDAWEPLEGKLPADLQPLVRELLGRAQGPGPALFLGVRSVAEPLARRHTLGSHGFQHDPESRLLTAHAFLDGKRRFLLAADGLLLAGGPGATPAARRLPPLPAGYQYTGLFVLDGLLFAPWEQVDFIRTGAAGIFISGDL
jgi:hypothetical protein